MEVRITFRSEIVITGETLADCAKQWKQIELFSDEAKQHDACQIELVSVEDAETFKDMLSEFNKID